MATAVTGAGWRSQFDGIRWSPYGGTSTPEHGGTRVIQIEQHGRQMGEVLQSIADEIEGNRAVIDDFHRLFYASRQTHGMAFYEGVPILKSPMDLWVYQEIIWDLKPTLIIETGTAYGGSALYFARQLDRVGGVGQVVTVDLEPAKTVPQHPRISYVSGYSSVHPGLLAHLCDVVNSHVENGGRVMVVLDSDHGKNHVLRELQAYAKFVTLGQFLVVEDTNINGRPVPIDWRGGPGPGPAVDEWMPDHPEFEYAVMAQRFLMTFHTWMRRIA